MKPANRHDPLSPAHQRQPSHPDAATFLARHTSLAIGDEDWGDPAAPARLRLSWYCTTAAPPPALVTSVRAIVLRGDAVLVVREPSGTPYIVPGGRCEPGETAEATLRREILEEVGWTLDAIQPLGVIHLRNLGPSPPGNPYPYPDAFQLVCQAHAIAHHPEAMVYDEFVANSTFTPLAEARLLPLRPGERALLDVLFAR